MPGVPLTDLPLEQLRDHLGDVAEPAGFDAFWADSLALAREHPLDLRLSPGPGPELAHVEVSDVRFCGWGGDRVAAWFLRPRNAPGPLPVVVKFIGYSGTRGRPVEHTEWAAAGYALLVVDTRGQGSDTPDPDTSATAGQWVNGFMTKGVQDPATYYYRRAYVDCARAVEAAAALPGVDPSRLVVAGGSQGGAFALAAAHLAGGAVSAALVDVPFLCSIRRACDVAGDGPYLEVVTFLRRHSREAVEQTFRTLAHVDGANHALRASAPALFSVGMMDPVCPPSTVFAAYNRYGRRAGAATGRPVRKDITVWEFSDHSGGAAHQFERQLRFLAELWRERA